MNDSSSIWGPKTAISIIGTTLQQCLLRRQFRMNRHVVDRWSVAMAPADFDGTNISWQFLSAMPDDMYCSEQICIPPSFPYLLRQYAKAAIRTQPSDLLKWSTAYFRCLSLNVPPPVKPRLEYPIPRDFNGITPGWLKTLLYQLQNNLTIPFKVLWDRWIGACLHHHTLIQLLCLGGFEDPQAIPWLQFVAICAATLTDDLTHTMILICEILTEEPEGGCAMVTLETFLDLYTFLARIDASSDQTLRNYCFRDSLLALWRDKVDKEEVREVELEESLVEPEESIATKTSTESVEEGERMEDEDKVVSCPSLPEDDHYSIGNYEGNKAERHVHATLLAEYLLKQEADPEDDMEEEMLEAADALEPQQPQEVLAEEEQEQEQEEEEQQEDEVPKPGSDNDLEGPKEEGPAPEPPAEEPSEEAPPKEYESVDTLIEQPVRDLDLAFEDEATLREDLERLRALQQEMAGETDDELEKFKCRLIEEMPLTQSQEDGAKHFKLAGAVSGREEEAEEEEKLQLISAEEGKSLSSVEEDKRPYDDVSVEAVPGIGPMVPEHLIGAVAEYMRGCAKHQHGMVMPRNIRHYSCPPLEA